MVAPISDVEPPLGGGQAILADLAAGLAEAGHRVTLLAAQGSSVRGVETVDLGVNWRELQPARFQPGEVRRDVVGQRRAFERVRAWLERHADSLDVVHAHAFDAPAFDALVGLTTTVLHTLHLPPVDASVVQAVTRAGDAGAWMAAVSHTSAHAWADAGIRVDAVVPNGVDVDAIPFGQTAGGYLLSAGRLTPEKGVDVAIRAAARAGLPLVIAGNVYDDGYYEQEILPRVRQAADWRVHEPLTPGATYVGHRPRAELHAIMAEASATVLPIGWEEPFGLVAVEAQAAGSPVVGFARGALREVVADGRTGLLVPPGDEDALAQALDRIVQIDRRSCRAWVTERFSIERMVRAYAQVYADASGRAVGS